MMYSYNINDLRKQVEECAAIKVFVMKVTDTKIHVRFAYTTDENRKRFYREHICNIKRAKKVTDNEINDIIRMIMSKEV